MEKNVNEIEQEESEMFMGALESKKKGKKNMAQIEKDATIETKQKK